MSGGCWLVAGHLTLVTDQDSSVLTSAPVTGQYVSGINCKECMVKTACYHANVPSRTRLRKSRFTVVKQIQVDFTLPQQQDACSRMHATKQQYATMLAVFAA